MEIQLLMEFHIKVVQKESFVRKEYLAQDLFCQQTSFVLARRKKIILKLANEHMKVSLKVLPYLIPSLVTLIDLVLSLTQLSFTGEFIPLTLAPVPWPFCSPFSLAACFFV